MEPWWVDPLRDVVAGRRVLLGGAVPPAWIDHVEHLRAAGAGPIMVVATEGSGAGDGPDVATAVVEPPDGAPFMERLRFSVRSLESPPPEVVVAVDEFDPDCEALAIGSFLNTASELAGRPFVAHRRPEWVALEDKVVVDAFWDRAGVPRLDSTVVDVGDAAAVAGSFDRGAGTVWAGDAREGFHGGGYHTHWVPDRASFDDVTARLRPSCDRVRVMPFVDGVACSIHGIVLPDGVAVLRPVELVTLRRGRELEYMGCATFWDPPDDVRDGMRTVAARVGEQLAAEVDFRGTFTVDGVADADGFWPTELNPRFGAGLNVIARANADLPVLLLNDLIVAGHPIGRSAAELEAVLVERADERRAGGTWKLGSGLDQPVERGACYGDGGWRWSEPDEQPDGHVLGERAFVRCRFEPSSVPNGPSVGPLAAAFWTFADEALGTALGPITAPPDTTRTRFA